MDEYGYYFINSISDAFYRQTPEHTSEPGRNVPVGNNGDGQNHGEIGIQNVVMLRAFAQYQTGAFK